MKRTKDEMNLLRDSVLHTIREFSAVGAPVSSAHMEYGLKLSGKDVRNIIRGLRREGELIEGSTNGYLISTKEKAILGLKKRIASMQKTIRDLEKNS